MNLKKIKDLYLVAFLICKGEKPSKTERSGPVLWFVFKESKENSQLIQDYWNNTTFVDARSFSEQIKNLKNRIFSENQNN